MQALLLVLVCHATGVTSTTDTSDTSGSSGTADKVTGADIFIDPGPGPWLHQVPETPPEYGRHDNHWLRAGRATRDARQLIDALASASTHGLDPESYALSAIRQQLAALPEHHRASPPALSYAQRHAALTSLLDAAFIGLLTHLGQGLVDGSQVQRGMYHERPTVRTAHLLSSIRKGRLRVDEALTRVTPSHAQYKRLQQKLKTRLQAWYQQTAPSLADQGDTMLTSAQTQNQGKTQARYQDTAGDKARDQAQLIRPEQVDAVFDSRGQHRQRLLEEIRAISLSLERWRWLPRDLGQRHILVNIPSFQLNVSLEDRTALSMPVVVGKTEHPTPSFSKAMSYMEFNPVWTVPASITNNTLIPRERRQPGYLASRGFEVLSYRNGRLSTLAGYRFSQDDLARKRFPHVLRQRSGPNNALGTIKFMMPNRHAIYLHDTPVKAHFSEPVRAQSHGCIRLAEPETLARWLLRSDGHSPAAIQTALDRKNRHRVSLRQPIPTHLVYMTTWVDDQDRLQLHDDIYQHDAPLLSALTEAGALAERLEKTTVDEYFPALAARQ